MWRGFVGSCWLGPGCPVLRVDTRENPVGKNGVMIGGEKRPCPEIKEKPYLFSLIEYFQTYPYKIYHLWLNWEVHWLKGNHKLDFPISLSHPNHSYK